MRLISCLCIVISILFIIKYVFKKHSNFINMRAIFKGYMEIFQDDIQSLVMFFVIPAILTGGLQFLGNVDVQKLDNINLILSIFLSMLLTMWGTISTYNAKNELHKNVLVETNNAILFETTIATLLLMINFIYIFLEKSLINNYFIIILSTTIYYLLNVIILNLFVIIKRIHKLSIEEIL